MELCRSVFDNYRKTSKIRPNFLWFKYMENFIEFKKIRNNFSYKKKQDILTQYESSGLSSTDFAKLININHRTLRNWIVKKDKIYSVNKTQLKSVRFGSGLKSLISTEIEYKLFAWIMDVRSYGIPITNEIVKAKGKILLEESGMNVKCNFSNGWIEKFKNRHNLCKRRGCSKIVRDKDCKLNTIIFFVDKIKEKIINIDETGIYYDMPINFRH